MKKGALFTTVGSIIILIISFIAFVLPSQLGSGQESTKKLFACKGTKKSLHWPIYFNEILFF